MPNNNLDCVVVGYDDPDFTRFATVQQKDVAPRESLPRNQDEFGTAGRPPETYIELMNRAIASATGSDPRLKVFEATLAWCAILECCTTETNPCLGFRAFAGEELCKL
jgi:hypothetical protein